jgi:hypothetical protein
MNIFGNVGIGTTTPGSKLDLWNNTASSNIDIFRIGTNVGSANNIKFRIDSDGDLFTDGSVTIGTPADIAESYTAMEALDAGTVVAFATSTVGWSATAGSATSTASSSDVYEISGVRKAHDGYESVGIVSTRPGINLGSDIINGVPIAFTGRVPVKVTTENGVIVRGDYLTVSKNMPGYAMKLTGEGKSIGRALSDYVEGRDKVMILVENGYQKLDLTGRYASTTAMLTTGNLDLNANGVAITNIKSLASANGTWSIDENGRIIAKSIAVDSVETKSFCIKDVCVTDTQLALLLQSANLINASTSQALISQVLGASSVSAAVSSANASISLNGSAVLEVNLNSTWSDTMGANYNHDGFTDVIYSTSTVDTSKVGTTKIEYFATYIPVAAGSQPQTIYATRDVVVVDPSTVTTVDTPITTNTDITATTNTTSTSTIESAPVTNSTPVSDPTPDPTPAPTSTVDQSAPSPTSTTTTP